MSPIKIAVMSIALASSSALAADYPTTAPTPTPRSTVSPELRFDGTPFSDCIDYLANSSGANIVVDWKALDAAKVAKDTPITLRLHSVTSLRKSLNMVLESAGGVGTLTFYVDDGVIRVTTQEQEDQKMITRLYPIGDLLFQPSDYTSAPSIDITQTSQNNTGGSGGGSGGGGGGGGQSLFGNSSGGSSQNNQTTAVSKATRADAIIKLITDTVRPEIWKVNGGIATISYYNDHLIITAPRSVHDMIGTQSFKH